MKNIFRSRWSPLFYLVPIALYFGYFYIRHYISPCSNLGFPSECAGIAMVMMYTIPIPLIISLVLFLLSIVYTPKTISFKIGSLKFKLSKIIVFAILILLTVLIPSLA